MSSMAPPRALVVEDEQSVQALVGRALSAQQIVCDFANDGTSARRKLDNSRYDIVVTDLKMPNGNGHALCQSVLADPERPLLVAITGLVEPRLRRDLEARGVDAIFEKPFDLFDFGKRIRKMVDERIAGPLVAAAASSAEPPFVEDLTQFERAHRPIVAILMGKQHEAAQLASLLRTSALKVFVAETTDFLCRLMEEHRIEILLIENVQYGFLNAREVLERLKDWPSIPQTLVIGDVPTFSSKQIQSMNVQRVFAKGASHSDIVQAVRSTLFNAERARLISPEAHALVRAVGVPPHSPAIVLKITEYLEMLPVEIPVPQLARDIMADSATAAELLRLANGSSLGIRRQISDVADALKYLGPSRAVVLLLSHTIRNMERNLCRKLPAAFYTWYQLRSVLTASVSSVFAERQFQLSADTAFVLSLFQDLGILVLAQAFGDRYIKVVEHARSVGTLRLHVAEQQSFHIDHAEVSAALVEHWRLPEKLVRPIRRHHDCGAIVAGCNDLSAFIRPMRIGESIADFWDNRHPARKNVVANCLAECHVAQASDHLELLSYAVCKTAEFAKLFRMPILDEVEALSICKDSLCRYAADDSDVQIDPSASANSPR
jgi:HD-like signal output (HDOD) protein/CheY-like chemotaxis protein